MLDMLTKKRKLKNSGFTVLEIVVVVVMCGILASVAIPKYTGAVEKARCAEGKYVLGSLLSAQERYFLEKNSFAAAIGDLDVEIPTPKYFLTPTVSSGCAAGVACATIERSGSIYTLKIDRDGEITCTGAKCADAGF